MSTIQVANMNIIYWSVYSLSRRGWSIGRREEVSLFQPAASFTLLEYTKLWCNIQVMIYLFFLHGVNCLLHHHHRVRGIRHGVGLRRRGGAPQGPFHCTNLRRQGDPGFSVCCQVWRGWVPGFHIVDKHIVLVDNSFLKTDFYKQLIKKIYC